MKARDIAQWQEQGPGFDPQQLKKKYSSKDYIIPHPVHIPFGSSKFQLLLDFLAIINDACCVGQGENISVHVYLSFWGIRQKNEIRIKSISNLICGIVIFDSYKLNSLDPFMRCVLYIARCII